MLDSEGSIYENSESVWPLGVGNEDAIKVKNKNIILCMM